MHSTIPSDQERLNKVLIAAKRLKQAAETASRLMWTDKEKGERLLSDALKRAEEDGL